MGWFRRLNRESLGGACDVCIVYSASNIADCFTAPNRLVGLVTHTPRDPRPDATMINTVWKYIQYIPHSPFKTLVE